MTKQLLDTLGYIQKPETVLLDDGTILPILCQIIKADKTPELWALEALESKEETDALNLKPQEVQLTEGNESQNTDMTWEELITKKMF